MNERQCLAVKEKQDETLWQASANCNSSAADLIRLTGLHQGAGAELNAGLVQLSRLL